ncbi:MAG: SDR family NAD(P)-dependent oxidoreductase [Sporolactobacillus sp.]
MCFVFKDKKILIIGGTGTIGKSIVKQILPDCPRLIRIFSRDEYKQQQFKEELGENDRLHFMIGDIRDYDRVFSAMADMDYVFHLAAMKQVDACEANPYEAVRTNVEGTKNVVKAAIAQKVKKVIFTSSDKAISPTNAYGATKLLGERLISAGNRSGQGYQTQFASVRFGNVMGSRGSVIPLFRESIRGKRKITITDKNMTRFMMTVNQATQLTLKALEEAKGGEVFVLKMPVINLGELTDILIEEIGKQESIKKEEVTIEVIGPRPGEKMYEELMTYDESQSAWELPDMYILPGDASDTQNYSHARKAQTSTYRSEGSEAIHGDELRALLKEAIVHGED